MKKIFCTSGSLIIAGIFCLLITIANNCQSQPKTYPSPEYSNYPYFFDRSTGKLVALEKTTAKMGSKTKAMGYGGSSAGYEIHGAQSSVTIQPGDTMEFVITMNGMMNMMDPNQMIALYSLKSEKDNREAIIQQNKGVFGKNSNDDNKISLLEKKSGDNMVLVVSKQLPPGEYAFVSLLSMSSSNSFDAYCFRIEKQ